MPLLWFCLFTDLLGFGIIIPLLPFMALRLGADAQLVTLLIATYSLALFVAAPFWGRVSDRIGRKPVLLISFVGTGSAFVVMAFADALWMLFAARAIAGLLSGDIAAAPAYVADVTPAERRARAMGLLGAAFGLAFCIGPGLGAYMIGGEPQAEDYRNLPLVSAGLSIFTLLIAAAFLKESRRPRTAAPASLSLRKYLRDLSAILAVPPMGLIVTIAFLVGIVFASMESTLALWTKEAFAWGPREVGYLFVYGGIVAVVCQGVLVGPMTRWLGESRLIVVSALLLGCGMAGVALSLNLASLLLAIGFLAAGFGFGNPALQSLISRVSREAAVGGALGVSQAANSLARVVGPALAGFLFATMGRDWPYYIGAALMLLVLVLAGGLMRRVPKGAVLKGDAVE